MQRNSAQQERLVATNGQNTRINSPAMKAPMTVMMNQYITDIKDFHNLATTCRFFYQLSKSHAVQRIPRKRHLDFSGIIIGQKNSGATSVLKRMTEGTYTEVKQDDDIFFRTLIINSQDYTETLRVWDLFGSEQQRYNRFAKQSNNKSFFLICIDLTNPSGIDQAKYYLDETKKNTSHYNPIIVLIGTKSDSPARCINDASIEADEVFRDIPYIPTSAKDNRGVDEAFKLVAQSLFDLGCPKSKPQEDKPQKCIIS